MVQPSERIPVSIITGFLGAGKSTFLNRLLRDPDMRDTAVIINEFGEVGIDHLLVESSGDAMVELSNGCLCCTVRGELTDTLVSLREGLATGRVLDYGGQSDDDRKLCSLYLSIMDRMGVKLDRFGDAEAPLAGI